MDIKRQSFLVMGLSKSGEAAAKFLLSQGGRVGVYDDLECERISLMKSRLVEAGAEDISKERLNETVSKYDALVLSPGIPIDHSLAVAFKRLAVATLGRACL